VRALARAVRIGQRWACRKDRAVVVVCQVHRGDRTVEAHREGEDPSAPGSRFQIAFQELSSKYRLLDERHSGDAA
jgi:hypothetical protein